ncbi:hypothetical protein K439DRAFT_1618843 [Ramaria rubella]|nr:hypothetical protein K439DRAFT_1618843 [Ramaria rubella]
MGSESVGPSLSHLLSAITEQELREYRAEVDTLTCFPMLGQLSEPARWVQLATLQQWLVERAHHPTSPAKTCHTELTTSQVKIEAQNSVIDLTDPPLTCQTCKKCRATRPPLEDDLQEIKSGHSAMIVPKGNLKDEEEVHLPQRNIKAEHGVVPQPTIDPEAHMAEHEMKPGVGSVAITRLQKLTRIEHMMALPWCWPIPTEPVAYVLDLRGDDCNWLNAEGEMIGMDAVIREHDQDDWGGSGSHSTDETRCPRVAVLDCQWCKRILLKCQECYTCDHLDPELLRNCERCDYDADQMWHVWDTECKLNEMQGSSVPSNTALFQLTLIIFYNQIQRAVCEYDDIVCEGQPVMRKWCKGGTNLDGKVYFVGCLAWKKEDPVKMHRFIPIPYNIDEELLLKMIQNHGVLLDDEIGTSTCALVVPWRIGAKIKQCPYPHSDDGQVVAGKMVLCTCPAQIEIFVPLDKTDHWACVVPRQTPHNHPAYPEHKLSALATREYAAAVEAFGAMGATIGKVDKAASTRKILGGVSPPKFHPAFSQRHPKERIIKKAKDQQAPKGFGLPGSNCHLASKTASCKKLFQKKKQYIHRIVDVAGIQLVVTMLPRLAVKMHVVRASLHDNTYKRTFGKWKEWEVVVWDHHLDTPFEQIWTVFFEVLEEVTGKPLKLAIFHQEGTFFAFLVDGDAGQAIGLGKYLCKINDPKISHIFETDPAILVQYILKTCWTHCTKNLDILATHLDNPEDVRYLRSFEHMQTDEEIKKFSEWCQNHPVKALCDWYENKVRHKCAYKFDLQQEEQMLLAAEHCLLRDSRNTLAHCMQHNSIRAAGCAQAALDRASDSEKAQELEELMVHLAAEAESRRPPSGLTSEECHASLEHSKIIQAQVTHLQNEGVSLCRGCKSKKAPEPSTQPSSSVVASGNTNMPPSTVPPLSACTSHDNAPLDPELDPANFDWSHLSYNDVFDADFAMAASLLGGLDGSDGGEDIYV